MIEVRDDGRGIPEELSSQLLRSYYLSRPGKSGVGLGLGVARQVARDHCGKLELKAAGPGGTIFLFTLPLA